MYREKYYVSKDLTYFINAKGTLAFSPEIPAWVWVNDDSKKALEGIKCGQSVEDFALAYAQENKLDYNEAHHLLLNFLETSPVVTKYPIKETKNKIDSFKYLDTVWLCPSGWCNLSCCYCAVDPPATKQNQKPLNFWIDTVKQCLELGAKEFVISGSEPTLYPNCIDLLVWINDNTDAGIQLLTNGISLNDKIIETLSRIRVDIQISLDGVSPETNDAIRGKGSFKKIVNTIKKLVKAGINPNISMTVCKLNIDDVDLMPKLTRKLGCQGLRIAPYFDTGRAAVVNSASLSDEERVNLTIKILRIRQMSQFPVSCGMGHLETPKIGDKSDLCGCANGLIAINYDGGVYACTDAIQIHNACAGNIEKEGLRQIMESKLFKKIRSASMYDIEECRSCIFRNLCSGGCPMERTFLNQIGLSCEKDCKLNKSIFKKLILEEI